MGQSSVCGFDVSRGCSVPSFEHDEGQMEPEEHRSGASLSDRKVFRRDLTNSGLPARFRSRFFSGTGQGCSPCCERLMDVRSLQVQSAIPVGIPRHKQPLTWGNDGMLLPREGGLFPCSRDVRHDCRSGPRKKTGIRSRGAIGIGGQTNDEP
jgi:hypothetical protein